MHYGALLRAHAHVRDRWLVDAVDRYYTERGPRTGHPVFCRVQRHRSHRVARVHETVPHRNGLPTSNTNATGRFQQVRSVGSATVRTANGCELCG